MCTCYSPDYDVQYDVSLNGFISKKKTIKYIKHVW